jgi:hypothetical protein
VWLKACRKSSLSIEIAMEIEKINEIFILKIGRGSIELHIRSQKVYLWEMRELSIEILNSHWQCNRHNSVSLFLLSLLDFDVIRVHTNHEVYSDKEYDKNRKIIKRSTSYLLKVRNLHVEGNDDCKSEVDAD